jgi:NADPH2:quinone reductase
MTTMKAAAVHEFGPAENLILTDVDIREPADGEVLIRVKAAAVNPADIGMRQGRYQWPEPLRMPMVPGYDIAGVVETGTRTFPAGTPVIGYTSHSKTQIGAYAEYATLPERLVAAAPTKLDWPHAAALPLAGLTAQTVVHHLALKPGETLLVNRAGGAVGRFVAELARAQGIVVWTDADGPQADAALDVVGGDTALATFARVRDGGRYATVVPEFWIPGGQFTPARDIEPLTVFVDEKLGDLAQLAHLADTGVLQPQVAATFPLASAADAHRRMERGGAQGKLILLP